MKMNEKIWFVFGLILMLGISSVAVAAGSDERTPYGYLAVNQSGEYGEQLKIGMLVSEPIVTEEGEGAKDIYDEIWEECKDAADVNACFLERAEDKFPEGAVLPEMYSLENARFRVMMYNPATGRYDAEVNCRGVGPEVVADNYEEITGYRDITIKYYYGTCTVPKEYFEGRRATFQVWYMPEEGISINYQKPTVEISDVKTSVAEIFKAAVADAIRAFTEAGVGAGGVATTTGTLPCIGVFLILGLLLASMYFAGKSPITLLDITSPRLPTPKGFMASGQVLLPYGYGEMKRALRGKAAAGISAITGTALLRGKRLGHSTNLEKWRKDIAKSGAGNDDKKFMNSLATLVEENNQMAKKGITKKISPDEAKKLFKTVPGMYGEAEHRTVAELLHNLRTRGGKDEALANIIKDYMQTQRTSRTMDVLSGQPDLHARSKLHQKISGQVGKYLGSNRYYVSSTAFGGSLDSVIRSARVAGRGTKEIFRQAPTAVRGISRTTIEMIGGKGALERMERAGKKGAKFPGMVAKELRKKGPSMELGKMMPVDEKMEHLYNKLRKELMASVKQFNVKELYRAMGVNFEVAEEKLAKMGYMDMDILKDSGYIKNAAKIEEMEGKLRAILTNAKLSDMAKIEELKKLAMSYGAFSDATGKKALADMEAFTAKLTKIEESKEAGYMKFIELNALLESHKKHAAAAGVGQVMDDGHFYTAVGRDSINGRDIWETMTLRTMIYDAENGLLGKGGGLKDELLSAQLNVINRTVTLKPTSNIHELPEYMRDVSKLQALEKRVVKNFGELLTEDGKKMLAEKGKTVHTATLDDYVAVGTGLTYSMKGVPRTFKEVDEKGRVAFWGAESEFGPAKGAFKVDMKRHWVSEIETGAPFSIGQWVNSRYERSYVGPQDPAIEAQLDRMPGSATWSVSERAAKGKELMVEKMLKEDTVNRFNSQFEYGSYGKTPEVARYYTGTLAGFMEKALMDRGMGEMHPDLNFVKTMDLSKPADLRKLGEIVKRYEGDFRNVLNHKVTFDDIVTSNKAYVMHYEGGFSFYRKGMPLSGADRVYGDVVIKDNKGQNRAFNVDDVAIEFRGRPDMQREFYKVQGSGDPKDWTAFMNAAEKWKGEHGYDHEREKVFGALCWRYGNQTCDMESHWAKSAVEIVPKREAMALAPTPFRMFGIESEMAERVMTPFKRYGETMGSYLANVGIGAGGKVFAASYDVTAHSETLRQQSMKTAMNIYQLDIKQLSPEERELYYRVAHEHGPYHHAWDWAIDRNPMRHSSSHGLQQGMESYFHFGPRSDYKAEDYVRGTMTKAEWNTFRAIHGFPLDIASKIQRPYSQMFGGMQMAMQGMPAKWDKSRNPLKAWDYTPSRFAEAGRALNPLSFTWGKSKMGQVPKKLNIWEGSLERHGLAGADILAGHAQAPQDIFGKRTGMYAVARYGEANPAASAYNYRNVLTVDPAQAEFLWRNREGVAMMDKEIREQAMSYTMNRNVSAEALAIRRQQELISFGVWQNSLYGWANPLAFAYHMPLPLVPPSMSPKEIATSAMRRAKMKDPGRRGSAAVGDTFRDAGQATLRFMQPWKGASVAFCPVCHKPGYKGARCSCGGRIY
jgi:hypothetical protein